MVRRIWYFLILVSLKWECLFIVYNDGMKGGVYGMKFKFLIFRDNGIYMVLIIFFL